MKNFFMKSKFYLILILMLIIASGTSYFAYAEYKEYKGVNSPTVSSNSSEDLSGYPIGVQMGYISLEYFEIINEVLDRYEEFSNKTSFFRRSSSSDEIKNEKYIELLTDEIVYLNSLDYSPANAIEMEIHEYFSSALYHQEKFLNYYLKYRNTNDKTFARLGDDENESFVQDMSITYKIMDKYQLFHEK